MPDASPNQVVEAAKETGIETTAAYVRWRRWADRKALALAVPADVPATFGGGHPRISDEYGDDGPAEVPVRFRDPTRFFRKDHDVPTSRRTMKKVPAEARPSVPLGRARGTTKKAVGSRAARATTDDELRKALGGFILEFGVARARDVLQQLESELLAAAHA